VEAVALVFSALASRLSLAAMWVPTLSFQPHDDILFNMYDIAKLAAHYLHEKGVRIWR